MLLERIIGATTKTGDLVADFFCGSGTTPVVAEKMNRKWIASDSGTWAIHTSKKRLLQLDHTPFVLRTFPPPKDTLQNQCEKTRILKYYGANKTKTPSPFHAKKGNRVVFVHTDTPISSKEILQILGSTTHKHIDILSFEYANNTHTIKDYTRKHTIDLALRYIPKELLYTPTTKKKLFFPYLATPSIQIHQNKGNIQIELVGFSLFAERFPQPCSQSKLFVQDNCLYSKDPKKTAGHKQLTTHWSDWIDYWSIDLGHDDKRPNLFQSHWQAFRHKKDRKMPLCTPKQKCTPTTKSIAIQIFDIFGQNKIYTVQIPSSNTASNNISL